MKISVVEMVGYKGHSISANGSVNLTLKAMYSELTKSVELLQMLNNDVTIKAKKGAEKAKKLGIFRIKSITFDGDGESVIKLNSIVDYVEIDNINDIVGGDEFKVLFSADIEDEENEEEE